MPRALMTGASGMAGQQLNVDVIANNIANVNTNGFKKQRVNFQDMFYETITAAGTKSSASGMNPTGTQVGYGVRVSSTPRMFSAGQIEQTASSTDMAIEGEGFFEVTLPDGSTGFTRAGDFRPDSNGNLVTPEGYFLVPNITIPDATTQTTISTTGFVTVTVDGAQQDMGRITLSRFRNPSGLSAQGRNLFKITDASGSAQSGTAGGTGYGLIRAGALEKGNVEVVTELVNMIVAQRAYEMNSKSVKTADELLRTANEISR